MADYSEVDNLGVWYKSVDLRATSRRFRLRKFGVHDITSFPVSIDMDSLGAAEALEEDAEEVTSDLHTQTAPFRGSAHTKAPFGQISTIKPHRLAQAHTCNALFRGRVRIDGALPHRFEDKETV